MTSKTLKARILDFIQSGKNFCTNENTCELDKFNVEQLIDKEGAYNLTITSFNPAATILRSPFSFKFSLRCDAKHFKKNDSFQLKSIESEWVYDGEQPTWVESSKGANNFYKLVKRTINEILPKSHIFHEQYK